MNFKFICVGMTVYIIAGCNANEKLLHYKVYYKTGKKR